MAAPSTPANFLVQQANAQVFLSWDITAGATGYPIYRSTDGVTYTLLTTPVVNYYTDTTVTAGTQYYYEVAASNGSGSSQVSVPQSIVPVRSGVMTLGQIRLLSQQKADRVNSNFVTVPEWNVYINQSAFELYDLLVDTYEDYYVKAPLLQATDGSTQQYTLPTDFYKLMGVDLGIASNNNAWVTLRKFDFIDRNRYVSPQLTSSYLGVFDLRYRLVGNTLMLIPTPSAGQYLRIWYVPRMTELLADTDQLDAISGWTEYVVIDAAIKALQKEESDVSVLAAQKMAIIKRIEESAMNRDAGAPDTISDTRRTSSWGDINGQSGAGF